MKRFFLSLSLMLTCCVLWSQSVLKVCYATSDDGFLNVRVEPSSKAEILTTLPMAFHGLGRGILIEEGQQWSEVRILNQTGWVYTKYMGTMGWYTQNGQPKLVAKKIVTPLWTYNYADDGPQYLYFGSVREGCIIADEYELLPNGYYVLKTGHDYIFVNKDDVTVEQ